MITEELYQEYVNGNHADAWREIAFVNYQQLQESERQVVDKIITEALTRIGRNVETLLGILQQEGFEYENFGDINPCNQPFRLNDPTTKQNHLNEIVRQETFIDFQGHIPLFYASFISHFNSIDFRGNFPFDVKLLLDALFINTYSNRQDLESMVMSCEFKEDEYIGIMFCPDQFIKENVSGDAGPRVIIAKDLLVDNFVANYTDDFDFTFMEYLRFCFHWGGFPNLYWANKEELEPFQNIVKEIRQSIIPF